MPGQVKTSDELGRLAGSDEREQPASGGSIDRSSVGGRLPPYGRLDEHDVPELHPSGVVDALGVRDPHDEGLHLEDDAKVAPQVGDDIAELDDVVLGRGYRS